MNNEFINDESATNARAEDMACFEYEAALEDYVQGQLGASDSKELVGHLAACSGCRNALALAEDSVRLLQVAESAPEPGPAFARVVMARIRAEEESRSDERASFWYPLVSLAGRFAATAAIALVLLLTYDVVGTRNSEPAITVASQPEATAIFTPEPVASPATRDDVLLMVAETNNGSN